MIKKITSLSLITSLLVFFSTSSAFSGGKKVDSEQTTGKRITAILPFTTRNCNEAYSDIVREILEINLHKSEAFVIIERSRMDLLLRERNLQETGCTDTTCAVEIGKLLSANYVLLGTLSKISNYTITVKLVDISKGTIVLADSEKAESEEKLEQAAITLAKRLAGNTKVTGPIIASGSAGVDIKSDRSDYYKAELNDDIRKLFYVSAGGLLTLDTDLGNVEVKGGDRNEVEIKISGHARDFIVELEKKGNNVYVTGKYMKWPFFWFWNINNIRFEITVPEKYNVNVKTKGGKIDVEKIEGTVNTITSGGGLKYREIKGPVTGTTAGGGIDLEKCTGRVFIKTVGGGINVEELNGDLNAHTTGGSLKFIKINGNISGGTTGGSITINDAIGSVDVNTTGGGLNLININGSVNAGTTAGGINAEIVSQPKSPCRLTTSAGSITLKLIHNVSIDIDANTTAGKVFCEFPVTTRVFGEVKKSSLNGKINEGGPVIFLRTSAGSIYIKEK